MDTRPNSQTALLGIIAVIVSAVALHFTKTAVVPLAMAFFASVVIKPIYDWLNRFVPSALALLIVPATVFTTSLLVWKFVHNAVRSFSHRTPFYASRFTELITELDTFAARFDVDLELDVLTTLKPVDLGVDLITNVLSSLVSFMAFGVLVVFMLVLMIAEASTFERKAERAFEAVTTEKLRKSVRSMVQKFQWYFLMKTLVSSLTGIATAVYLQVLNVDFAVTWGILAFGLNFIPSLGSIIAVIPPILTAVLQFSGFSQPVAVGVGLLMIQLTIGNFLDPRLMGRSLSLSPLAVFVSMVLWGVIWGIGGVFLAVPLTVAIRILCEHIEDLRPVYVLLGAGNEDPSADGPDATPVPTLPISFSRSRASETTLVPEHQADQIHANLRASAAVVIDAHSTPQPDQATSVEHVGSHSVDSHGEGGDVLAPTTLPLAGQTTAPDAS